MGCGGAPACALCRVPAPVCASRGASRQVRGNSATSAAAAELKQHGIGVLRHVTPRLLRGHVTASGFVGHHCDSGRWWRLGPPCSIKAASSTNPSIISLPGSRSWSQVLTPLLSSSFQGEQGLSCCMACGQPQQRPCGPSCSLHRCPQQRARPESRHRSLRHDLDFETPSSCPRRANKQLCVRPSVSTWARPVCR